MFGFLRSVLPEIIFSLKLEKESAFFLWQVNKKNLPLSRYEK